MLERTNLAAVAGQIFVQSHGMSANTRGEYIGCLLSSCHQFATILPFLEINFTRGKGEKSRC
jgi:hypothetical protein